MKIPDDLRSSFNDLTDKVVQGGKHLGNQAQLMTSVKKLQIEHAKRVHELGKKTFAWFESGTMIVSGPVPPEVAALCGELADLKKQIGDNEAKIEAAKQEGQVKFLPPEDAPASIPMPPSTAAPGDDAPKA